KRLFDGAGDVFVPVDPPGLDAEAAGDEIVARILERDDHFTILAVQEVLRDTRHSPFGVVQDHGDDRQSVPDHRVELLYVEADPAVAGKADHRAVRVGARRAYRKAGRDAEAAEIAAPQVLPRARRADEVPDPVAGFTAVGDHRGSFGQGIHDR